MYSRRNHAQIAALKPQMDAIKLRTRAAQASGLSVETARAEEAAQLQALFTKHECNPFRGFIMPVVQAPFMICKRILQRAEPIAHHDILRVNGRRKAAEAAVHTGLQGVT